MKYVEIYKLFWVLTVLSLSFGYGFRLWVEASQVMEGTTPQKTLTDFIMQAQITSLDRKAHSFLAVHRQKPPTEPSLAPCTAPSWAFVFSQVPQPVKLYPPAAPTPADTHPLIPWTSALNYNIPSLDAGKEESTGPSPSDPSLPLSTRLPWYWSTRESSEKNSLVPRTPHKCSTFSSYCCTKLCLWPSSE